MLLATGAAIGSGQTIRAWAVDPLTKVFRDEAPSNASLEPIEVARGEQAEWQIVVRSDKEISSLHVSAGSFHSPQGSLRAPRIRFVSYVNVDRSMSQPAKDILRKAPAEYPDPLITEAPQMVAAETNQPIWIDTPIPAGAPPGDYEATVQVTGTISGKAFRIKSAIRMRIFNVSVGKSRLWVTNWFFTTTGHMPGANSPGSKEEDGYLKVLAKSMAAHRQNVALVNPLELAKFTWDASGKMSADFTRFDDWVKIFKDAGVIGRIEGGHIGGRLTGAWESQFGVTIKQYDKGNVVEKLVPPDSPEAQAFYAEYLPLLTAHLKHKRWLGQYMQHLADEPIDSNVATYQQMATLVRTYAPELKIIEATHTKELAGDLQVWVPQLNYAHDGYDFYKERQKEGEEFWTYTCVWPEGEYANRFIELPLIKTRLLHWLNYRYGITGYLHWGFNYWVKGDPFDDVTRTKAKDGWDGFLPAGDSWIVYPKDGRLVDSIRYETMRDGIGDYELLSMLGEKDPKSAHDLAERLILAFDRYDTNVQTFRSVRRSLLEQLSN